MRREQPQHRALAAEVREADSLDAGAILVLEDGVGADRCGDDEDGHAPAEDERHASHEVRG